MSEFPEEIEKMENIIRKLLDDFQKTHDLKDKLILSKILLNLSNSYDDIFDIFDRNLYDIDEDDLEDWDDVEDYDDEGL